MQAEILDLLDDLRHQLGLALLFISHDFGVVARIADRVLVLEHGEVCEQGSVAQVLSHPTQATTRRLLAASRSLQGEPTRRRGEPAAPVVETHDDATSSAGARGAHTLRPRGR